MKVMRCEPQLEIDSDKITIISGKEYKVNYSTVAHQVICDDGENLQDKINKLILLKSQLAQYVRDAINAMQACQDLEARIKGALASASSMEAFATSLKDMAEAINNSSDVDHNLS